MPFLRRDGGSSPSLGGEAQPWAAKGAAGMKRYFEFTGADADRGTSNSAKFWEVEVSGSTVTVRFGKIGATGQTTVKEFDSANAATAHADKLIGDKTKKGYVESTGTEP